MNDLFSGVSGHEWFILALCALSVGMAKAGMAGMGMLPMILMAEIVAGKMSSGALLLLLIVGDAFAVRTFHQHAVWSYLKKVLPPAIVGVLVGSFLMGKIDNEQFRPLIGWLTLVLTLLHVVRNRLGRWVESSYHTPFFAWFMGGMGGVTTMVANAAGPVMTMFFLAMNMPKFEFVATNAWFFFIVNLSKVPFSVGLGLMTWHFVYLTIVMIPVVYLGILLGKWLLRLIPEKVYQFLIVSFTFIGGLRLILS